MVYCESTSLIGCASVDYLLIVNACVCDVIIQDLVHQSLASMRGSRRLVHHTDNSPLTASTAGSIKKYHKSLFSH